MKIGEIKVQVISLMYPDEAPMLDETDEESFNVALYEIECNPNFQGILEGCTGAVNRCLAYLEGRGFGEINCAHFQGKACPTDESGAIVLDLPPDASCVQSVILRSGKTVIYPEYRVEGKRVVTERYLGIYTVTYKPKMQKISTVTANSYDIYLPLGMDRQIPYYVLADLTAQENPQLSKWARDTFDESLEWAEKTSLPPCQACVLSVYEGE